MDDRQLAEVLVARINALCQDDAVRDFVGTLMKMRVEVADSVVGHPTIQVAMPEKRAGILGLLNGIIGSQREQGYLVAVFDSESGMLLRCEVVGD